MLIHTFDVWLERNNFIAPGPVAFIVTTEHVIVA